MTAFAATLPESYRRNFGPAAIAEHARLSRARASSGVALGLFDAGRRDGAAICVVAEDRPGLLATISAALVICELDVIEAEAYTRRVPGVRDEAVDVFWVRERDPASRSRPITSARVERLHEVLVELLEGKLSTPPPGTAAGAPTPSSSETIVRFIEDMAGSFSTLEVETGDRSGLLLALSQALFKQRVQIVTSQVKTVDHRVYDRFNIVEFDGSPITPARRLEIQVAILAAIDPILEQQITARTPAVPPVQN